MSDLPQRQHKEATTHTANLEGELTAMTLGQTIIAGLAALPDETNPLKEALRTGGADGLAGTEFFGDETWGNVPTLPEKVDGVKMKPADRVDIDQAQLREEQ